MGGSHSWRQVLTGEDWMRDVEKRILHEERRPNIQTASDLLGPGIAPFSIWIDDWNAPETAFNGFFHSEPGAFNVPSNTRYWMGPVRPPATGTGCSGCRSTAAIRVTCCGRGPPICASFSHSGTRSFSAWR